MSIYYTYESFEEFEGGRSYIGVRKCPEQFSPTTDPYLGSYRDKSFHPTAKRILGVYDDKVQALQAEIDLHLQFDVAKNPHFANRARATSTGFTRDGRKASEETRRKLSEARRGENLSDETKRKLSEARRRENLSDITRKKLSEAKRGKSPSDITRKRISEGLKGRKVSDETRKKLSEAHRLENLSDEKRKRISEGQRGKKMSDEARKKISKLLDWFHPIHGGVLKTSAAELTRKFPEQRLHSNCLNHVGTGKRSHHKGWRCVNI